MHSERAVVGFDDIPLARQVTPALTTARQALVEKGGIAAELLFGRRRRAWPAILWA